MARFGVTYQDIASAANQIVEQGRQPTIELIRQILKTGSSTTISNHLRQWRADQEGGLAQASKESIPQEMLGMLKGLWERLNVEADQKANQIEEKTQHEITALSLSLEKYQTNNRRWQQLFLQWQAEKEHLLSDNIVLSEHLNAEENEAKQLRTKLAAETNLLQEKRLRIEELHRLHQQTHANLTEDRAQHLQAQAKFNEAKQKMEQETKDLNEQLSLAKEKIISVQQAYQALQQSFVQLRDNHTKQIEEMNEMQVSKIKYAEISQHWEKQYLELKHTNELQNKQLIELLAENKIIMQNLQLATQSLEEQQHLNKLLKAETETAA